MLAARGVGVVLRQSAVTNHEKLHVLEQPRARPKTVPLVAVNLVERLTNVHTATLKLNVNHRQAIDQHGDVVAVRVVRATHAAVDLVLVDDLQSVVVDVLLVEQSDVLGRAILAFKDLHVVFLDANRLFDDAVILASDLLRGELLPLAVGEDDAVEGFELDTKVRDQLGFRRHCHVFIRLRTQQPNQFLLQRRLRLVRRLGHGIRNILGNDRALRRHSNRIVLTRHRLTHAALSSNVNRRSR